jgi:hypothetical protein
MVELARKIHFPNPETAALVRTSTAYGRIRYALVGQAWRIQFIGRDADVSGNLDEKALKNATHPYNVLWNHWRELERSRPGIGEAIARRRALLK